MSKRRIGFGAVAVLAANVAFGYATSAFAAEGPAKCPEERVECNVHADCANLPGFSQCNICNPFPFGLNCISYN